MGITVAAKKILEATEMRRARYADQHRARSSLLDQTDAAEDEGAHDDLADLRRANHQCAYMRGIEGQRRATLGAGSAAGQHPPAGKLIHLAGDLAHVMRCDWCLSIEGVPTHDVDRAFQHEPGRRVSLADVEHDLAGRKRARGPAGKTLRRFDLRRVENRENLLASLLDDTHGGFLAQFSADGAVPAEVRDNAIPLALSGGSGSCRAGSD
jgi:hypothetical protein